MSTVVPDEVGALRWDVEPADRDAELHADRIIERVMMRGGLAAMRWLVAHDDEARLRAFVVARGTEVLPARDLAFWSAALSVEEPAAARAPTGGRPGWAD